MTAKGKLLRMDNILIVVDDLEAAKAFFAEPPQLLSLSKTLFKNDPEIQRLQ
jgi:hypothetical protein